MRKALVRCSGIHNFQTPYEYETNVPEIKGGMSEFGGLLDETSVVRANAVLKELLRHITTHHYRKGDLASAAVYATALRHLAPVCTPFEFTPHDTFLHNELNQRFGMNPPTHSYQAVDTLRQILIDELAQHGIR